MKPLIALSLGVCLLAACASPRTSRPPLAAPTTTPSPAQPVKPSEPSPPTSGGLREVFPHIRADFTARLVEFDGTVPIDVHDPQTPVVYLEVTVCTPDTKEHESLVVTPARPSHIHAALLAAGFQPGSPGSWKWEARKLLSIPPRGDPLDVSIAYTNAQGVEVEAPATAWIRNSAATGPRFAASPRSHFVFAGSALVRRGGREVYDADGSGLLIGLTTFGSEAIAWSEIISHEADIAEPEWIADARLVPRFGTPVVVRIRPVR